jgi:LPS sulfotransferase NodH
MPGIAVIARQRSGTNFLRSLIAASSNFTNLSEVFDIKAKRANENFFKFRENTGWQWKPMRESAECVQELSQFFDTLHEQHSQHIIDIKYNQTMVCLPTYISPTSLLPVFQALQSRKYCIVHLVREDVCASIVSGMVANVSGTFHVPRAADGGAPKAQVRLVPEQLLGEIGRREREIDLFDHLCRWMGNHVRVRYEDLSRASPPDQTRLLQNICKRGGGGFTQLGQPAFKKGLGHWLDYVENRDDVLRTLASQERFHKYLPPDYEIPAVATA